MKVKRFCTSINVKEVFLLMYFQFEMASGKVLEETYRRWVQYKEDCVKMIENEPLLQGTDGVQYF